VLSSASQENSPFYLSLKALKNILMEEISEEKRKGNVVIKHIIISQL
jgi:hypothetical protein